MVTRLPEHELLHVALVFHLVQDVAEVKVVQRKPMVVALNVRTHQASRSLLHLLLFGFESLLVLGDAVVLALLDFLIEERSNVEVLGGVRLSVQSNEVAANLDAESRAHGDLQGLLRQNKSSKSRLVVLDPEAAFLVVDLAVASRYADIRDLHITVVVSANEVGPDHPFESLHRELCSVVPCLWVQDVDIPCRGLIQEHRLKHDVVGIDVWQVYQRVAPSIVHELVGKWRFA